MSTTHSDKNLYSPVAEDFPLQKTSIRVLNYDVDSFSSETGVAIENITQLSNSKMVTWIRVTGLSDQLALTNLCNSFHIHPLAIEDIFHTYQRPKVDDYGDFIFVVLRLYCVKEKKICSQQVSFVLSNNFILSFEEFEDAGFKAIEDKLAVGSGNIRKRGEDYLLYTLLDTAIDNYYTIEEFFSEEIDTIEEQLTTDPKRIHFFNILSLRREIIHLRKNISPIHEVIGNLMRLDVSFFDKENKPYLRDLLDHSMRAEDSIEMFRDILGGLMDLYHSQVNNKMNEVMKTLTVMSSIFIPLTFIVGVYGMNFDFMPELHSHYGYIGVWLVMLAVAGGLIFYFKRKKYF